MIRKLKVLGIALVAVFAFSAVGASASQAFEFTSFNTETMEHESGTSVGDQTEGNKHKFTATTGFGSIQCTKAHFTGSSTSGTETEPVSHPEYSGCTDSLGRTVHVTTAGCNYKFHVTKETEAGMKYEGTADIVCEAGKSIVVQITKAFQPGSVACEVTVGAQNGTGPVKFTNDTNTTEPTDVTVESEATNIKDTVRNVSSGGCFGVEDGSYTNGSYTGNTTVRAYNTLEEQIDLTVM